MDDHDIRHYFKFFYIDDVIFEVENGLENELFDKNKGEKKVGRVVTHPLLQ